MVSEAYINRIATCVPAHEVHSRFVQYAFDQLQGDDRNLRLFRRLSELGGIERRYSVLSLDKTADSVFAEEFYTSGAFPSTSHRMLVFEKEAPLLAKQAVENLILGGDKDKITHLIVTSCTGMSAPGIDLQVAKACDLPSGVERTMIGFMGCYAAINGFKLARHIVRSESGSKVLIINIELCSLHLHESKNLEEILCYYLFADGCAASLVTSEPTGICMDSFQALLAPDTENLITWTIRDSGFDMYLSGKVPAALRETMCSKGNEVLRGAAIEDIDLWAVHPGGRSILDAVQAGLDLPPHALDASREVLKQYGNMSSPTVVFVLKALMEKASPGQRGCAMSFGPGLVAETMLFHTV